MGREERILFEGKDFSREFEDLPSFSHLFEKDDPIENISSVNQQIAEVYKYKNVSPEERFYNFITNKVGERGPANFNQDHLDGTDGPLFEALKEADIPDMTMPLSIMRMMSRKPFRPEYE